MIPQHIIDSAPDEPDSIALLRKARPRTKRDGSNRNDERIRNEKHHNASQICYALTEAGFEKIKIHIGPTTYTLWNTKQNLQTMNKKLKSKQ